MNKEQMSKELLEAGWEQRKSSGGYYWWPPVMKEVIDNEAERSHGLHIERAYDWLISRRKIKERKEALKAGTILVLCNKCGVDMRKFDTNNNLAKIIPMIPAEPADEPYYVGTYGMVDASVSGGFYSEHLRDTITYRFNICEKCLNEYFSTFVIPPITECYL